MTNNEEFDFEEEDVLAAADRETVTAGEEQSREPMSQGARKGLPRVLLLVLLLVILGAAGSYFFLGKPQAPPPPPAPAAAKKQPIAVPPQTQAAPAVPVQPQAETAVVAEVIPEERPAVATPAPDSKPAVGDAPAGNYRYTVEAGAFRLESNLNRAEERLRRLGFEPRVTRGKKITAMTRLRVGAFAPAEGRARIEELAELAPDAFAVRQGDEVVVYAASYHDLDKARRFADRLYAQGLRVEEEAARVEVPLFLLSFGEYTDLTSARDAAAQVRADGLGAFVVKKQ